MLHQETVEDDYVARLPSMFDLLAAIAARRRPACWSDANEHRLSEPSSGGFHNRSPFKPATNFGSIRAMRFVAESSGRIDLPGWSTFVSETERTAEIAARRFKADRLVSAT